MAKTTTAQKRRGAQTLDTPEALPVAQAGTPPATTPPIRKLRWRLEPHHALPEDQQRAGRLAVSGLFAASGVMSPIQGNQAGDKATPDAIMAGLAEQAEMVQADNLSEVETMLLTQAIGLQSLWASLTRRATAQEYMPHFQAFMGMALKAQAQSRATLEALVELKQPRTPTFVRQANVAHGPQQVVNHPPEAMYARARNQGPAPNKLLDAAPTIEGAP